jgi:hypothetical protein
MGVREDYDDVPGRRRIPSLAEIAIIAVLLLLIGVLESGQIPNEISRQSNAIQSGR